MAELNLLKTTDVLVTKPSTINVEEKTTRIGCAIKKAEFPMLVPK
jgi:hypothetical protein